MSLKIRLARGGAKKAPFYRVIVTDGRNPRDGKFIEKVGTYNPLLGKDDAKRMDLNIERVKHWLALGAQPTDRVARYLAGHELVKWAHGNNPNKGKPKAKAQERMREEAAKAEAAASA